MIYIDTNVFVYAIENHPRFGRNCRRILEDIEGERLEASCSVLVLAELVNVLKKINDVISKQGKKVLNIERNIEAVMSLPVVWIDLDFLVIEKASTYKFDVNGIDYMHVASMELNSMNEILSADRELDKVNLIRRTDPLDYHGARA